MFIFYLAWLYYYGYILVANELFSVATAASLARTSIFFPWVFDEIVSHTTLTNYEPLTVFGLKLLNEACFNDADSSPESTISDLMIVELGLSYSILF